MVFVRLSGSDAACCAAEPRPIAAPGTAAADQATPDAGGPGADSGAIAIPKKKEKPEDVAPPPAPAAPKIKNPEGMPTYSLRVEVPEVTVDVGVLLERPASSCPI